MKKKNLSFMTLFMLTASLIGGCSCNKQSNENVSNLVIKVGEKEYSASELYDSLLSSGTGANEAFAKVLRMVVESSMKTTTNIQSAADLAAENFEEEVKTNAQSNGVSTDEARKSLLEEKGYSSVEEMKSEIIYEQKLTRITESFWEENKASYYDEFVENRLPYLVRHVLVKIDATNGNKIGNNVTVTQDDAKDLFDVIKRFEKGGNENRFSYIASNFSEDTGSVATGGAYYMDNTFGANGFVDEFAYGVYAFDAYTTKTVVDGVTSYTYGADQNKLNKLAGLSDTEAFAKYYENGFNFVNMSVVNMLGEVYNQISSSEKDYFEINAYNKEIGENDEVTYTSASSNLNETSNYYARAILFNQAFNKPGVSVIGYDTKEEAEANTNGNYVELKMGETSKYILTDTEGNPIFFVAARGDNNNLWIHFLTINVSALDDVENAKKFFSLAPDSEDDYISYVELMDLENTAQSANSYISTLESYVKSYATAGIGSSVGEESLLKYDMVEYYMNKNSIDYLNDQLKSAIESYISNRKTYLKTKLLNTISEDWDTHTDKLTYNISEFNQMGVKPYECAVLVNADAEAIDNPYTALTSSDRLCRYVYGDGYQVQLSYYYDSTSSGSTNKSFTKIELNDTNSNNRNLYFTGTSGYTQWVTIGDENTNHIVLPTPATASDYVFDGWYTNKGLTDEVAKDSSGKYYIDLSESRLTNNTIFFAKFSKIAATTINYKYQFSNGTEVSNDILPHIVNTNVTSQTYSATSDNTITLSKSLIGFDQDISSPYFTVSKFLNSSGQEITDIELTSEDYGDTIDVIVEVEPVNTTLVYEYVTSDGSDALNNADTNTNPTSITYTAGGSNDVAISLDLFTWKDTYEAQSIKVARNDATFNDSNNEDSLTLTQTDMGQTIKIYVVVGEK